MDNYLEVVLYKQCSNCKNLLSYKYKKGNSCIFCGVVWKKEKKSKEYIEIIERNDNAKGNTGSK